MAPVFLLAGAWAVLFANNLKVLPNLLGYDVTGHLPYIRYIQENHALPLASEGWEMFQPPLYYVVCAAILQMLSLSVADAVGIMALRVLGKAIVSAVDAGFSKAWWTIVDTHVTTIVSCAFL